MKTKIEYNELSKAKISEARNIVISSTSKGGFTIAQQLSAQDGDKKTSVFMKGAFHIDDIKGLYELRDAINFAIKVSEKSEEDSEEWD